MPCPAAALSARCWVWGAHSAASPAACARGRFPTQTLRAEITTQQSAKHRQSSRSPSPGALNALMANGAGWRDGPASGSFYANDAMYGYDAIPTRMPIEGSPS
eukprot:scaffold25750_cov146-Isochrysis_galbana.AAC.2